MAKLRGCAAPHSGPAVSFRERYDFIHIAHFILAFSLAGTVGGEHCSPRSGPPDSDTAVIFRERCDFIHIAHFRPSISHTGVLRRGEHCSPGRVRAAAIRLSFFVSDMISFTMLISDQAFPMREYSVGANIVRPPTLHQFYLQ